MMFCFVVLWVVNCYVSCFISLHVVTQFSYSYFIQKCPFFSLSLEEWLTTQILSVEVICHWWMLHFESFYFFKSYLTKFYSLCCLYWDLWNFSFELARYHKLILHQYYERYHSIIALGCLSCGILGLIHLWFLHQWDNPIPAVCCYLSKLLFFLVWPWTISIKEPKLSKSFLLSAKAQHLTASTLLVSVYHIDPELSSSLSIIIFSSSQLLPILCFHASLAHSGLNTSLTPRCFLIW